MSENGTNVPGNSVAPRRRAAAKWAIAYILAAAATHCSGLFQPMHCDYSCRLRVARDWASGMALYRETYDNPHPIVFLWVRENGSPLSAFSAEVCLGCVACLFFRAALLRVIPRLAGLVPLLLIVVSGVGPTFYGGQIAEAPALWLDVIGLSCFWHALRRGGCWFALAAGASYFLLTCFRVPSAVHLVSWLPFLWAERGSRRAWKMAAWAAAGALAATGVFLLFGLAGGYLGDYFVVFRRNLSYGSLDRVPLELSLVEGAKTLARILLQNTLVGLLLTTSLVMLAVLRKSLRRRERVWLAASLLWLVAALASAFPGGRHYAHYYHFLWPAVSFLALLWLAPLRRRVLPAPRRRLIDRLALAIVLGALVMGACSQAYVAAQNLRDLARGTHFRNSAERAVEFLDRETTRETPVLVNVWLDWAELYWRVPRPAPSLTIPHVVPADRYQEWAEVTLRDMPEWVVTDGTPWEPVDGPLTDPAARALRDELAARLEREYTQVESFENLRILRRKRVP